VMNHNFQKFICLLFVTVILLTTVNGQNKKLMLNFPNNSTILFQGDSITDGGRGRGADPNHILGHSYAILIAAPNAAQFPERGYNFLNRGISGNKITDLEARWQKDTIDLKPDYLSILIGINDAATFVNNGANAIPSEEFEQKYEALLQETLKDLPNVRLILCEPFVFGSPKIGVKFPAYQLENNKRRLIVEKLAKKYNLPLVHFQKMFEAAAKKAPIEYWVWDGVHPTFAGHQLMAEEWVRTVNEFIKKNNWKVKNK
jgi:lysophospholipase L1-like esterase